MVKEKQVDLKQYNNFVKQVDGWIKYLNKQVKVNNSKDVNIIGLENKIKKLEEDIGFMKFLIMVIFDKLLTKQMREEVLTRKGIEKTIKNLDELFGIKKK